jgi:hypothetical protein
VQSNLSGEDNTAKLLNKIEASTMHPIKKQIVTDEFMHPVAVIIDYSDWQDIEAILKSSPDSIQSTDLSSFAGSISLPLDPLAYQEQIRNEWQ